MKHRLQARTVLRAGGWGEEEWEGALLSRISCRPDHEHPSGEREKELVPIPRTSSLTPSYQQPSRAKAGTPHQGRGKTQGFLAPLRNLVQTSHITRLETGKGILFFKDPTTKSQGVLHL